MIYLAFMKTQIDASECAGVLGTKAKNKFNDPVDAFKFVNYQRHQNNVPSEDSNESVTRLSLSDRFKGLTSNSIPSNSTNGQIANNELAMTKRPVSRARRTGGSEQNNASKTNSLPETARSSQPSVLEQPVAKKTVSACPPLPTNEPIKSTVPKCPVPSMFENVSSDDELPSIEETVAKVAKNSQINNTQNGK